VVSVSQSASYQTPDTRVGYQSLYAGLSRPSRFDTPTSTSPGALPQAGSRLLSQAKAALGQGSVSALTSVIGTVPDQPGTAGVE
jgi:hypothetical protein